MHGTISVIVRSTLLLLGADNKPAYVNLLTKAHMEHTRDHGYSRYQKSSLGGISKSPAAREATLLRLDNNAAWRKYVDAIKRQHNMTLDDALAEARDTYACASLHMHGGSTIAEAADSCSRSRK